MQVENEVEVSVDFHTKQGDIFYPIPPESQAQFVIIRKGRRFGLTEGFARYLIKEMMNGVSPMLWVDTIHSNIDRYVSRLFLPILSRFPRSLWKWRENKKELTIRGGVADFRSAEKPENIEGFGYRVIILNEAGIILKNPSLWQQSILPMILDYKAQVFIGGTPKGKKDAKRKERDGKDYSLFYELAERGNPESPTYDPRFRTLDFSSYDNPMLDKEDIDGLLLDIPAILRDQEIFGQFVDVGLGNIFNSTWWKYYEKLPKSFEFRLISVDTAFKKNRENDFSVATMWGLARSGMYLIDMWRDRVEFPELKRKAKELVKEFKPDIMIVEDEGSGQSLIQELERDCLVPVKGIRPDRDKIARATANTPLIEQGKVWIPEGKFWVKDFAEEHQEFPNGAHDDIVDSTSQALDYLKGMETGARAEWL